jgi:hypothetical protein
MRALRLLLLVPALAAFARGSKPTDRIRSVGPNH